MNAVDPSLASLGLAFALGGGVCFALGCFVARLDALRREDRRRWRALWPGVDESATPETRQPRW